MNKRNVKSYSQKNKINNYNKLLPSSLTNKKIFSFNNRNNFSNSRIDKIYNKSSLKIEIIKNKKRKKFIFLQRKKYF